VRDRLSYQCFFHSNIFVNLHLERLFPELTQSLEGHDIKVEVLQFLVSLLAAKKLLLLGQITSGATV
jgi:hypothetical protein